MNKPIRIQRKRTKGWRMPPNTVSVTRPGKWGNPFKVTETMTPQMAKDAFKVHVETNPDLKAEIKRELKGKNVACFCKIENPCHGDDLLDIANS